MEGIKYINLVQISIEIWGVENGNLVIPVNYILVCHTSLITDIQPYILIVSIYAILPIVLRIMHGIWSIHNKGKAKEILSRIVQRIEQITSTLLPLLITVR